MCSLLTSLLLAIHARRACSVNELPCHPPKQIARMAQPLPLILSLPSLFPPNALPTGSTACLHYLLAWLHCPAVVGSPAVEHCLSGLNTTIITYGQPGSGKTHTLLGELPADGTEALPAQVGMVG